jgi:hypothetical protein
MHSSVIGDIKSAILTAFYAKLAEKLSKLWRFSHIVDLIGDYATYCLGLKQPFTHTLQKEKMTTIKQLNNDLIAMERQGLIKKAGYKYNRAEVPEQQYESTQSGNDKFWAFELAHLSDADGETLKQSGYPARRTKALHRRNPAVKTRAVLEQAQQAMRARQQKELNRQLRVLLKRLAKRQNWERRIAAMS